MSKLAQQLKEKLAANLEAHAAAEKGFDGFDVYKTSRLQTIAVTDIRPNLAQPRIQFDPELLQELADSIEKNGLLQPITVRNTAQGYEIVAGERRFRAMQLLGRTSIDCLVVHVTDQQNALLALAENLARQDLSDYETAMAIDKIQNVFESKVELAKALGIGRSKLYKLLAFNELPSDILLSLSDNPNLLSADVSEQIKSLKKDLSVDEVVFNAALSKAIDELVAGNIKQSHVVDFITSDILDGKNKCPNSDTSSVSPTRSPASTNIKKMYVRDGKSIGRVKSDGKKFVVELTAQTLTNEQEEQLLVFLDALLEK